MRYRFYAAVISLTFCHAVQAGPGDDYQGRLYRLCKIYGYVKYYHSSVSNCELNWDSILVATIPAVKAAADSNQFNVALLQMLNAAGPMAPPDTSPAVLDPQTAINVDNTWQADPYLSQPVRAFLNSIQVNFRPHNGCYVQYSDYTSSNEGLLLFPGDSVYSITSTYPSEAVRLLMLFRYWNILKYFNPNSQITNVPWDTALLNSVLFFANAPNATELYKSLLRLAAQLNDTHAQGLTWSASSPFPGWYYPNLNLVYADSSYVVAKSEYAALTRGDIIDSLNGLSTQEWEDSLINYISASNMSVFRRDIIPVMLAGTGNAHFAYHDSTGTHKTLDIARGTYLNNWYNYVDAAIDTNAQYKTIGCDIGYVNMGNLTPYGCQPMYDSFQNKSAIIFDIRNYPQGTAWYLAPLMLAQTVNVANFLTPDVTYPGNFYWTDEPLGPNGIQTPYQGKVILLMNEQTQSQAEFTCMILSQNQNVIKIGSQTAGADGNITYFDLTSDLHAGYTNLGTYYPNGVNTQRIGIVPDIVVKPTIAGIRNGVDEVLDSAIAIACNPTGIRKIDTEAAIKLYPNPASTLITLECPDNLETLRIKLSGLCGEHIADVSMSGSTQSISIAQLSSGLYFINILDRNNMTIKSLKFVKQ